MRLLVSRLDGPYGAALPEILHRAGHTVVGTAAVGWPGQPRFVEEIKYTSSGIDSLGDPVHSCEGIDQEELKEWVRASDGYIVDLFFDIIEARAILQHVVRDRPNEEEGKLPKRYLAISNVLTWANTKRPVDPDAPEPEPDAEPVLPAPFTAEDRVAPEEGEAPVRVPHPLYKREAGFEDMLCDTEWFNLDPTVLCTGMVYGDGELWLHPTMLKAWQTGRLPAAALAAANRVPMVHRADVVTIVSDCFGEARPDAKYMLVVDEATGTFGQVAQSLQSELCGGRSPEPADPEAEAEQHAEMVQQAVRHGYPDAVLYTSDLLLDPGPFLAAMGEEDPEADRPRWRARQGLVAAAKAVVEEYKRARALGPKRILLDTAGRVRPEDPTDFLGKFMLQYDPNSTDFLEPGHLELPAFGKAADSGV